jgi:hypothetical protein
MTLLVFVAKLVVIGREKCLPAQITEMIIQDFLGRLKKILKQRISFELEFDIDLWQIYVSLLKSNEK